MRTTSFHHAHEFEVGQLSFLSGWERQGSSHKAAVAGQEEWESIERHRRTPASVVYKPVTNWSDYRPAA